MAPPLSYVRGRKLGKLGNGSATVRECSLVDGVLSWANKSQSDGYDSKNKNQLVAALFCVDASASVHHEECAEHLNGSKNCYWADQESDDQEDAANNFKGRNKGSNEFCCWNTHLNEGALRSRDRVFAVFLESMRNHDEAEREAKNKTCYVLKCL